MDEAKKYMEDFISHERPQLNEGDYIVRNKFGLGKYAFPTENQVMRIHELMGHHHDKDGEIVNASVYVAHGPGMISSHKIDTAFYEKMKAPKKNVFSLIKKDK